MEGVAAPVARVSYLHQVLLQEWGPADPNSGCLGLLQCQFSGS